MESELFGIFGIHSCQKYVGSDPGNPFYTYMRVKRMVRDTLVKYFKISAEELISN